MSPTTHKPWNPESYLRDTQHKGAIYIRMKGQLGGGSMIQSISPQGVNLPYADKDGNLKVRGMSWLELFVGCEQFDGTVCGVKR